jgi:hypothetical protein
VIVSDPVVAGTEKVPHCGADSLPTGSGVKGDLVAFPPITVDPLKKVNPD